ncbi:MAG: glycerophosphodiester phosphodiesterase [Methyloceanibacter sp.]|nr:glycerophosphodiester phosphodiesterase [Methyloceanibacter sp.]
MANLDWLKQPIAHRGLHDASKGIIENSASAIKAAITKGFAVEVDLQCAADNKPIVFHDLTLDRLTDQTGPVISRSASELTAIPLRGSKDRILSLRDLLAQIDGRVPLVIEIKSKWDEDDRYEANIASELAPYRGPVAVMSFDPNCVARFATLLPSLPRGLIAEKFEDKQYWSRLSWGRRFIMRHLLTAAIDRPHFIAYDIRALPALAPALARSLFRLPLLTWTVRTEAEKARAANYADTMIFEGIEP